MNDDFARSLANEHTAYILATSQEFMQAMKRRLSGVPLPEPAQYPVIIVANAATLEFRLFYEAAAQVPPAANTFVLLPEEPSYVA